MGWGSSRRPARGPPAGHTTPWLQTRGQKGLGNGPALFPPVLADSRNFRWHSAPGALCAPSLTAGGRLGSAATTIAALASSPPALGLSQVLSTTLPDWRESAVRLAPGKRIDPE